MAVALRPELSCILFAVTILITGFNLWKYTGSVHNRHLTGQSLKSTNISNNIEMMAHSYSGVTV